jgi:hypothetical protein
MGHTPALLYTLERLPFGFTRARFPYILNSIREPLLGPLHSHTLYYAPTNRSGVTSTHILPRFTRLPESNTKSPRVKKTMQATFVVKSEVMGFILGACLM